MWGSWRSGEEFWPPSLFVGIIICKVFGIVSCFLKKSGYSPPLDTKYGHEDKDMWLKSFIIP